MLYQLSYASPFRGASDKQRTNKEVSTAGMGLQRTVMEGGSVLQILSFGNVSETYQSGFDGTPRPADRGRNR